MDRPKDDAHFRLDRARRRASNGDLAGALDDYLWLWREIPTKCDSLVGVRSSFMASSIKALTRTYPPAYAAFRFVRDLTVTSLSYAPADTHLLNDFLVLNRILDDAAATLAWFDRAVADDSLKEVLPLLEHCLAQLLIRRGRWHDLAWLYPRPAEFIQRAHALSLLALRSSSRGPGAFRDHLRDVAVQHFRDEVAKVFVALSSARRNLEARAAVSQALTLSTDPDLLFAIYQYAVSLNLLSQGQLDALISLPSSPSKAAAEFIDRLKRTLPDDP